MSKERFQSKGGFILASVGAAVGLGNALRFPGLCAQYGGGAFLLVYFVSLAVLGVPLLNAEIALGRLVRGGAPACMAGIKRGAARLGWASCCNATVTAVVYAGLAGWLAAAAATMPSLVQEAPSLSRGEVSAYFFESVLSARSDGVISGISPLVLVCIAAVWLLMYACLKGGARRLSHAARFTVAVPVALLTLMAARGLMYGNAAQALGALFIPDFSKLAGAGLWLNALGQVFFSLSVAVGIMPAYGAYLPEGCNVFSSSLVIAAADFLVSVLASVALFTTLYGCGLQAEIGRSGIITAFAVYPVALSVLFGGSYALNAAAGVLFYVSLCMMAVQSAVSMLEAFVCPYAAAYGRDKKRVAAAVCLIGAPFSLVFATTASVLAVEIADRFVNFYNVLLLGVAECLLLGHGGQCGALLKEVNAFGGRLKMPRGLFACSLKFLSPAVLGALTAAELIRLAVYGLDYPPLMQFVFGWGLSLAVFAAAHLLSAAQYRQAAAYYRKL